MAVSLVCKTHPAYKAIYGPRFTVKYPGGCPVCTVIWNAKRVALEGGALIIFVRQ